MTPDFENDCQYRPPMISYAQNAEDVLLRRAFADEHRGYYIDVGANHPVELSITKYFCDRGWTGINIEPGSIFSLLPDQRPHDINLHLGISDRPGELTFYDFQNGLSTFSRDEAHKAIDAGFECHETLVPVTTLASVCQQHVRGEIDFLCIDVEGYEPQVIRSADWKQWRPKIIVVEATRLPAGGAWETDLLDSDYLPAFFDGLNRYYVRGEDSRLLKHFRSPPNVFDNFTPYRWLQPIQQLEAGLAAAESERQQQLDELNTKHQHQLEVLQAEQQRKIDELSAGHRQQLQATAVEQQGKVDRLSAKHQHELEVLQAVQLRKVEALTSGHEQLLQQQLAELQSQHLQAIERLTHQHARKVGEVRQQLQREYLRSIETVRSENRRAARQLRQQIATLETRLQPSAGLQPWSLAAARRLQRLADRLGRTDKHMDRQAASRKPAA